MLTFSSESSRHSQDADALSISRTLRTARSVPSMTKSCVRATFTRSESRTLAIRAGIPFASFPQRASLTFCPHSCVSLSPSQTMRTAGMVASCSFTSARMGTVMRGCWLAPRSSGGLLSSFFSISQKQEPASPTASSEPMIYFRRLRFGQMRRRSPNLIPLP